VIRQDFQNKALAAKIKENRALVLFSASKPLPSG
jgi:hypothetical protein